MAPHTPNNDSSNGNGSGGAPFHSRSNTARGGNNNRSDGNNNNNNKRKKWLYQPSVHQFTCRGAFHLQPQNNNPNNQNQKQTQKKNDEPITTTEDELEELIKDTFLCNGIQTKLRHVSDLPMTQSKEGAIHWFEQGPLGHLDVHSAAAGTGDGAPYAPGLDNNNKNHADDDENIKSNSNDNDKNKEETRGGDDDGYIEPESTFSSYGTTQVNILTVQEIPIEVHDEPVDYKQRNRNNPHDPFNNMEDDPFGGFGSIASSGMLNPFGSLFGGFFGGSDAFDPWNNNAGVGGEMSADGNTRGGGGNWMKGSRSVSSSTRMDHDANGKRVVTTVTTTTTVDNEGNRKVETVTTERHVDDGGRVETSKVVKVDDLANKNAISSSDSGSKKNENGGNESKAKNDHDNSQQPNHPSRNHPHRHPTQQQHPLFPHSPFHPDAISPIKTLEVPLEPTKPPEVAVIAADCLLGVSISDSVAHDPDSALPPKQQKGGKKGSSSSKSNNDNDNNLRDKAGWRKTEYLFRLGRFIPPFMIVNKYYQDKEEEERRRREMQKEYNDMRDRLKKNRWDERKKKDEAASEDDQDNTGTTPSSILPNNTGTLSSSSANELTSRTEYYLQRIYVQMNKNLEMMGIICKETVFQRDFPGKVYNQGIKIGYIIAPTMERTGKLMKDTWDMWMNSWDGSNK